MRDIWKEAYEEGRKEGADIAIAIVSMLEKGLPPEDVSEKICEQFGISPEVAARYIAKFRKK